MQDIHARTREVCEQVIAPNAVAVDRGGRFPREAVAALSGAGLLGLLSAPDVGGEGQDLRAALVVVREVATHCGSSAMVLLMHYAGASVVEAHGPRDVREAIARGAHLTTLALSETGSRSHFWTPLSTASRNGDVTLSADKSWITSAGEADSYVWSSRPVESDGAMTLWLVPARAAGLEVQGSFDGLGLRGNASCPVRASHVSIPASNRLGPDGAGLDIALGVVLPVFLVLNAAFSLGLMDAVTRATTAHLTGTRLQHLGRSLAEQPQRRAALARMRLLTDAVDALVADTVTALEQGREDAQLRVLEVKAFAARAATEVTDLAMETCGGSAFRRDLGIERRFRDSRAAGVMAPTTDALLDFVGRMLTGLPLLDAENA